MLRWRKEDIAYCANVHPGITAAAIEDHLKDITCAVKHMGQQPSMAAGLWINENALLEYKNETNKNRLIETLKELNLKAITFNGFPQGNFHQKIVKTEVYTPTWAEDSRLNYTKALASLLSECLPDDVDTGSISTLPLAYRNNWSGEAHQQACQQLMAFAAHAEIIHKNTGKQIRLCLEMEPGCVLEKTDQAIRFFTEDLKHYAARYGFPQSLVDNYLGLCYDVCHQAVMRETVRDSLNAIRQANIIIGKIQISSALCASFTEPDEYRKHLSSFAEAKYMHQCTAQNSETHYSDDLVDALQKKAFLEANNWRIHYHLPIQSDRIIIGNQLVNGLSTTQHHILEVLDALADFDYSPHLEIETYTWQVLPETLRPKNTQDLIQGLHNERQWLIQALATRNLIQ